MIKLLEHAFQIVDLKPDTEVVDTVINLTVHLKLKAVMEMREVAFLFGQPLVEPTDGDNEKQGELLPPLELCPGFWDGSGSPRNEKTVIAFSGLEFKELFFSCFEKIGSSPAKKKPFLSFKNARANTFRLTPSHSREVVLTFWVHANDDVKGEHIGRLSDDLSKAGFFKLEIEDLFDKVAGMEGDED